MVKTTLPGLPLPVFYFLQMHLPIYPDSFLTKEPHHIWFKQQTEMSSPGCLPETLLLCKQLELIPLSSYPYAGQFKTSPNSQFLTKGISHLGERPHSLSAGG